MGINFRTILQKKNLINVLNPLVVQKLLQLDGHVIFSRGKLDYRYHILDLQHRKHPTKQRDGTSCNKEWAFGHIMILEDKIYFSERTTPNEQVEEYSISSSVYNNLSTNKKFDVDRWGKLIDSTNVDFIVNSILNLKSQGLIQ